MFGWSTLLRNSAIEAPQKLFAKNYFAAASPNIAQGARCGLGGDPAVRNVIPDAPKRHGSSGEFWDGSLKA